jgi:hypothetical protein
VAERIHTQASTSFGGIITQPVCTQTMANLMDDNGIKDYSDDPDLKK